MFSAFKITSLITVDSLQLQITIFDSWYLILGNVRVVDKCTHSELLLRDQAYLQRQPSKPKHRQRKKMGEHKAIRTKDKKIILISNER